MFAMIDILYLFQYDEGGVTIEPFNLKSDRDAGYFDENMNFVFRKEKGEIDNWLANMDESEMEKAIGEAALAVKVLVVLPVRWSVIQFDNI